MLKTQRQKIGITIYSAGHTEGFVETAGRTRTCSLTATLDGRLADSSFCSPDGGATRSGHSPIEEPFFSFLSFLVVATCGVYTYGKVNIM